MYVYFEFNCDRYRRLGVVEVVGGCGGCRGKENWFGEWERFVYLVKRGKAVDFDDCPNCNISLARWRRAWVLRLTDLYSWESVLWSGRKLEETLVGRCFESSKCEHNLV